jgi:hypothetical protein
MSPQGVWKSALTDSHQSIQDAIGLEPDVLRRRHFADLCGTKRYERR